MLKNNALLKELPVSSIFEPLAETLRNRSNAVIIAPPGSGKTTAIAPILLQEDWCQGQIILLSPRRLAAKAAAERIAQIMGEPVGQTVGYLTRMESQRSDKSRILVVTQGIFRHQIQQDPELPNISAVLFDEVHERSLDSDFSLALALDVQSALRPDLRLIAMSATMDGTRFSDLMAEEGAGKASLLESQGRCYPLHYYYEGRRPDLSIEQNMATVIRRALLENDGGILAFLPGIAEIERTAALLENLPSNILLYRLHSSVDFREQHAAIQAVPKGYRKIVLASAIAETSLTLDGIRIVVDSGLTRRARYDRQSGLTRLVTERVSRASAEQRAGRAGRQDVGYVWRLWEEAAQVGLSPYDPPEITEADLSALTLDCALWGVTPNQLRWIDSPPEKAIEEAYKRLENLQAISSYKRPLPHGRDLAALPMPLPFGHMILKAKAKGWGALAVDVAVLLSERGIGGMDIDIENRLNRFYREKTLRSQKARQLANRWRKQVGLTISSKRDVIEMGDVGACVALAFPDRVAKRRDTKGEQWISAGGRGFRLDPLSPLAQSEWLAVAEAQGSAQSARILSAATLMTEQINALFSEKIVVEQNVRFNFATKSVETERLQRLDAIILSRGQDDSPDEEAIASALMAAVQQYGLDILPWSDAALALRERWAFVAAHQSEEKAFSDGGLSDDTLLSKVDEWLYPLLLGCRRLDQIKASDLTQALENILGWQGKQKLDQWVPARLITPAGSSHVIDYKADGGPAVEVRPQALFGMKKHPMLLNGRVALVLRLVSPAGRPIQTTQNLTDFWAGSWNMIAKEMRGRYPRHPWPEDPASAEPTLRTQKGRKIS